MVIELNMKKVVDKTIKIYKSFEIIYVVKLINEEKL